MFSGLSDPLFVTDAGDRTNRLFIVERTGTIRVAVNGQLQATPFLDVSSLITDADTEQGLLGLAFHPFYFFNGRFFIAYTAAGTGANTVASYLVSSNPNQANASSGSVILSIADTYSNHNGGNLAFGPDGYLYFGTGDGGGAGDPDGNAQNLGSLLGKMLRLNVDTTSTYTVPATNAFVGRSGVSGEIWAYGLRNPWRFSFDRATGDLYIADVGQDRYEEVDFQPANAGGGQNYGWNRMEGLHCYPSGNSCNQRGLTLPIREYSHDFGCAVTGGYVYRGAAMPAAQGRYIYGDYCSGTIWALRRDRNGVWVQTTLLQSGLLISSFGQDQAGELYVTDLNGDVYRLDKVS